MGSGGFYGREVKNCGKPGRKIADCEYVLVGLGDEWGKAEQSEAEAAYDALYELTGGKGLFYCYYSDGCPEFSKLL